MTNCSACLDGNNDYKLITTSGNSVTSQVTLPNIAYLEPNLQTQDGSYFGIVDFNYPSGPSDDFLAKFDASGNIQWSVPGYYAQMATADGGVPQYPGSDSSGGMFFYGVPGAGTIGSPFQPAIHWGPSNILWLQNYAADSARSIQ